MQKISTKQIARAGIISALYVVLSLITLPFASGGAQFRLSEGLTLLPLIFPESIVGVFVGCLLTNLIAGGAIIDIIFGSFITLVSAICTYFIGKWIKNSFLKIFIGGFFPVLLNAFLLPLVWYLCYGQLQYVYILQAVLLLLSQGVSVYIVGGTLYFGALNLQKRGVKFFK